MPLYPYVCKLRPCSVSIDHHSRVTGELAPSPWRFSIEVQVGMLFTELLQSEREQNVTKLRTGYNIHTLRHTVQGCISSMHRLINPLTRGFAAWSWTLLDHELQVNNSLNLFVDVQQGTMLKLSCMICGYECNPEISFYASCIFCGIKQLPVVLVFMTKAPHFILHQYDFLSFMEKQKVKFWQLVLHGLRLSCFNKTKPLLKQQLSIQLLHYISYLLKPYDVLWQTNWNLNKYSFGGFS